ncbi:hypothetical protein HELRODRAFT_146810, partial [Helobdella robusta]|uniref:Egal-1 winged helix domain-containing protein n=1 Tax=Helobdella robusta TaxID=6412 RepID=T1EJU7_HELRO
KMAEEASQKSMLYFLEVLMNSNKPITLTQLAGHFGRRSFSNEMRIAAGGNELGLRNLLSRYPSIFSI